MGIFLLKERTVNRVTISFKAHMHSIWEEFKDILKGIKKTFLKCWNIWWEGSTTEKVVELTLAALLGWFFPTVTVGIAAANFIDEDNTVWLVITAAVAFAILEVLSVAYMEVIVLLAMIQLARGARKYVQRYYDKVELKREAKLRMASVS
jgi:hypothetical protein